jgi:3',5'-nucleoside bisphosphate phosphatase
MPGPRRKQSMIDLHTHSTASDGLLTPTALVEQAASAGISAIALTDHDTVAGLPEASVAAARLGLRFIRGIEMEIAFEPGEFHLLGLDLHSIKPPLVEITARMALSREDRNRSMIDLLQADGVDIDYEELLQRAGAGAIGRPHIAELLVHKKIVKNKQAAFDRYLAKGKPYYLRKACVELDEAIRVIHDSGGLAFVAHPLSLFASWSRLRTLFGEWKERGIDGIEAWHPIARVRDCERLAAMARESGFRISAGSDYHGPTRPERKLGHTAGEKPIGEEFLSALAR